jgi:Xaa-Pro aminopeptidase
MATTPAFPFRIQQLRTALKKQGLDGWCVPRTDEFLGEYVPPSAERLQWLTGFTGSWGLAIIAAKSTALVVDGRYTIQAAKETKAVAPVILPPDNEKLVDYLKQAIGKGKTLGYDPWVTSVSEARRIEKLATKAGVALKASVNAIDAIWSDRPSPPSNPVYAHTESLAGLSAKEKLRLLALALATKNTDAAILSDPHSVAWALNLRGSDVAHTPLALLRAIINKNGTAQLFVDAGRISKEALDSLRGFVTLSQPSMFEKQLTKLGAQKKRVMIDPACCPEAIRLLLAKAKATLMEESDPCSLPRARKNATEQSGTRAAHLRDGAALSNFLCWLETAAAAGELTEKRAQDKLEKFRHATGKLEDLSFGSISASGPNAALPHYHVASGQGRLLKRDEIYLIDSGGQYRDGTTDVTRTVIIGKASPAMKRHNTLVLKGMIAVSEAQFPAGTTGVQLDALARQALWRAGFDFDHGTGHGVGSFLSVHEGPQRISKASHVPLEPGMILSNEPGYYLKGRYGIRIENLLLVKTPQKPKGGDRPMLSFETLTFAPIDKRLIDDSLLTRDELQWLDGYHAEVLRKIGTRVAPETRAWLQAACAPLTHKA